MLFWRTWFSFQLIRLYLMHLIIFKYRYCEKPYWSKRLTSIYNKHAHLFAWDFFTELDKLPHENWTFSVSFFFITATYAALRLKWRGKCFNSLCLMCGCRLLAAGFHKCIAYVGAALRLSGDETVKIDIGWQRGCGWSQIFLVCCGGRVLPPFAQSAPLLCPRE